MKVIRKSFVSALLAVTATVMAGATMAVAAAAPSSASKASAARQDVTRHSDGLHRRRGLQRQRSRQCQRWHDMDHPSPSHEALPLRRRLLGWEALRGGRRRGDGGIHAECREVLVSGRHGRQRPTVGASCPQVQHCVAVGDNETVLGDERRRAELGQGALPVRGHGRCVVHDADPLRRRDEQRRRDPRDQQRDDVDGDTGAVLRGSRS